MLLRSAESKCVLTDLNSLGKRYASIKKTDDLQLIANHPAFSLQSPYGGNSLKRHVSAKLTESLHAD